MIKRPRCRQEGEITALEGKKTKKKRRAKGSRREKNRTTTGKGTERKGNRWTDRKTNLK